MEANLQFTQLHFILEQLKLDCYSTLKMEMTIMLCLSGVQMARFISSASLVEPCARQINCSKPVFVCLFIFCCVYVERLNIPVPSSPQSGKRFPMVLLGCRFHVEMVSGSL